MKKIIRIGLLAFTMVLFVALFFLRDYLTFENLKLYKDFIVDFASTHYFLTAAVFLVTSTAWANLPLVLVMSIAGGLLFGTLNGAFYNVIAITIGSSVGFWLVRYLFHDPLRSKYNKIVQKVDEKVARNGFCYFFALRAALICPYFLINIIGGLSKIEYGKFLLSTLLGAIPEAVIYSYSGSVIGTINSPHDLFSWKVVTAVVLVVLFGLAPVFTRAYRKFTLS